MYLGLDIGTSSVKAVLLDEDQDQVASASAPLTVERPQPSWSEQDPDAWWDACVAVLDGLAAEYPVQMAVVAGIGLSGQMHGATLLDAADRPLRPCILWNDGRSAAECAALEAAEPRFWTLGGNRVMPGFTAPKLAWVRAHEPEIFARTARVLLPKDYVRLKLTGEHVSDMSDSAGTLWMDVGARAWCEPLLAATGLDLDHMPRLVEGSEASGAVRAELAARWGFAKVPVVAGGAGDNAASACGVGAVAPGTAFVSLGTSGVLFVTNDRFSPNVASAVHAFCHAVPQTWHQMGVILSATDNLNWLARTLGERPEALTAALGPVDGPAPVLFLPYLSGERTPHNDAAIRGAFVGLGHESGRDSLTHSVLDGVAFALKDCLDALVAAGARIDRLTAVGGGSRSRTWVRILSSVLGVSIDIPSDGDFGAAFGAARLGQAAALGRLDGLFEPPPLSVSIDPDPTLSRAYGEAHARWRKLYPALKEI